MCSKNQELLTSQGANLQLAVRYSPYVGATLCVRLNSPRCILDEYILQDEKGGVFSFAPPKTVRTLAP